MLQSTAGIREPMKTIATFTKPEEAHLMRMRLEEAGIEAFLLDEHMIQMDLLQSNAIGGVRVQIADEDIQAARELLSSDAGAGAAEPLDSPACPKCGSTAVERENFSRRFAYISLLLFGIPLLFIRRRLRCSDCLHTWQP